MFKIKQIILILILSNLTVVAMSQNKSAMFKQEMRNSMDDMCSNQNFLSCTGLKGEQCFVATNKTIMKCDPLFPKIVSEKTDKDAFAAHENCMKVEFPKNTGLSIKKLNSCG